MTDSTKSRRARPRPEHPLPLFDRSPPRRSPAAELPPAQQSSRTSKAAARSVAHAVGFIETRIIDWLIDRGEQGGTADEAEEALDLRQATGSARFSEMTKAGRVLRTDRTRPTRSGRAAAVHLHPDFSRPLATPAEVNMAASRFAAEEGEPPAEQIRPAGSQTELLDSPAAPAAGESTLGHSDRAAGSAESPCSPPTRPPISASSPTGGNSTNGGQGCQAAS